jgi:hypothetical protein
VCKQTSSGQDYDQQLLGETWICFKQQTWMQPRTLKGDKLLSNLIEDIISRCSSRVNRYHLPIRLHMNIIPAWLANFDF